MANKDKWCSRCNKFPDEIDVILSKVVEHRKWNTEEYELEDIDYGMDMVERCAVCNGELETREETNVKTMS